MSLNKTQKVNVCCHVARGVRIAKDDQTPERLKVLGNTGIHMEDLKEQRKLIRLGLADLDPIFEKALVVLADVPPTNHLGLTKEQMTDAKANGQIVYRPVENADGTAVKTTDGQIYTKGKGGTLKKVGPKKESKKDRRKRRKQERLAAGKAQ